MIINSFPKYSDVWKEVRSRHRSLEEKDEKFDEDINLYLKTMEERKNKWAKVADFEAKQTVIKVLSFERVEGGKYVDQFGKSNVLTFELDGEEKILDVASYTFGKAFKNSGCKSGDTAMIFTMGFKDPHVDRSYRFWIIQKLGEPLPTDRPVAKAVEVKDDKPSLEEVDW